MATQRHFGHLILFAITKCSLLLLSVFCAIFPQNVQAANISLTNMSLKSTLHGHELTLDLSQKVKFSVFSLPAQPEKASRLVIDLDEVQWNVKNDIALRSDIIRNIRMGLNQPGTSRLVLDMKQDTKIIKYDLIPVKTGVRLRILFHMSNNQMTATPTKPPVLQKAVDTPPSPPPVSSVKAPPKKNESAQQIDNVLAKLAQRPPLPSPTAAQKSQPTKPPAVLTQPKTNIVTTADSSIKPPSPSLKAKATASDTLPQTADQMPKTAFVIALDPGHGGQDPGAMTQGVFEKNLTLEFAKILGQTLEKQHNIKVVFTRNDDIFLSLRSRVDKAREAHADLMLSLHADLTKETHVSGASIYTLSEQASDAEAAALAESENAVDELAGIKMNNTDEDIRRILIDLAQRESLNESQKFAKLFIDQANKKIQLLEKRPHRVANFRVLKAPDIPSVLIELGFLSNPDDFSRLTNPAWQQQAATVIAQTVQLWIKNRYAHPAIALNPP